MPHAIDCSWSDGICTCGSEIERLRGIIDCGCNAIHDAVAVSGGDLKRIDAVQRRMRREMSVGAR